MSWKKLGNIFHLEDSPCRSNHVQVPTVSIRDSYVRVYYACRNKGKSFPAFFDLDRRDLTKVVHIHEETIMELGAPGDFDSDGIMPSSVIDTGNEIWMYYTGWNARAEGARYHNAIGLAVSIDGGVMFKKKYRGSIVDRTKNEYGLAVTPFVMYKNWYRMWYISGISWNKIGGKYEPVYVIKYADSVNGIDWSRKPEQCVKSHSPLEAFSNPSVIYKNGSWHMWYCYRHSVDYRDGLGSYRIGYAKSTDGVSFERLDELSGIDVSEFGWDSTMICYPYVIEIDDKIYMFYNGNSFGQTGIGLAVWEGELL